MINQLLEKNDKLVTMSDTTESDVDHLMTLIRKVQESEGSDLDKYPLLSLFCDWTKHIFLDRKAAQGVVIELNNVLYHVKDVSENDKVINEISQIISFERLQTELRSFLFDRSLSLSIVTKKELWLRFVINLISIISDCPLELPENHRKKVINSVKDGVVAISLRFTWAKESLFTHNSSTEKVWTLIITSSDTTKIILPCKVLGLYLTANDNNEK